MSTHARTPAHTHKTHANTWKHTHASTPNSAHVYKRLSSYHQRDLPRERIGVVARGQLLHYFVHLGPAFLWWEWVNGAKMCRCISEKWVGCDVSARVSRVVHVFCMCIVCKMQFIMRLNSIVRARNCGANEYVVCEYTYAEESIKVCIPIGTK